MPSILRSITKVLQPGLVFAQRLGALGHLLLQPGIEFQELRFGLLAGAHVAGGP